MTQRAKLKRGHRADDDLAAAPAQLPYSDFLSCRSGRRRGDVTGRATRPEDVRVNDPLSIEGDEKRVRRHLDRCDPDWTGYLKLAER
jgi:hypothetical protein